MHKDIKGDDQTIWPNIALMFTNVASPFPGNSARTPPQRFSKALFSSRLTTL